MITIPDQGKGWIRTFRSAGAGKSAEGSGRGIFLIRSFMDEVKIRDPNPGTEVKLIKHWPQRGECQGGGFTVSMKATNRQVDGVALWI